MSTAVLLMTALEIGMDMTLRLIGPVLICVASMLVIACVYIFFNTVVYFLAAPYTITFVFHSSCVVWLAGNILFNYYACVLIKPGFAPTEEELAAEADESAPLTEDARERRLQPDRSHYCHITKRQVLRMDHFCPWVGNCIGFYNYKYFYLFLFYLWCGCMYGLVITAVPFLKCLHFRSRGSDADPICHSRSQISFGFIITLSVGIAVGLLLAFHTYLILSAQTTIEFYYNKFSSKARKYRGEVFLNEFDLGRRKNWHAVFGNGRYSFSWMLPNLAPPPGDGFEYPTRSEMFRQDLRSV